MRRVIAIWATVASLAVPSAVSAAGWTPPETVSEAGNYDTVGCVSIAAGPRHGAIAWCRHGGTRPRGEIRAARASAGRGFGRSVPLRAQDAAVGDTAVGVDVRGNSYVAYRRHVVRNHRIEWVTLRPNGDRTLPDLLSGAGSSAYDPTFALANGQPPRLTWWRRETNRLQVATFRGASQAPVDTLSLPGAPTASFAQESDGSLIAATVAGNQVQVAEQRSGEPFGPLAPVSAVGRVQDPRIAVGPSDSAVVIWRQFDGRTYRLMGATRPDGTAPFSVPRTVTEDDVRVNQPAVAMTSGGTPMAIYLASAPGPGQSDTGVLFLVNLATGTERLLSPSRARVSGARIAADGADRVSVVWLGTPIWKRGPVYAVTTERSSTRGAVRRLTGRSERARFAPDLASNAPGVGFRAAWASAGGKVRAVRR